MIGFWLILIIIILFGLVVFRGSPYVPSHKADVIQSLTELYKINKNDTLIDIGSGDGAILRQAIKLGAKRAVGYEINPLLVLISKFLSRKYKKVNIILSDFWFISLPKDTTVIYVFSVTRDIKNIVKLIQKETNKLNKSMYLISYGNNIEGLQSIKSVGAYYLYIFKPLQSDKAQV